MLASDIAKQIIANKKSGKWISCHFDIDTPEGVKSIGVKAFGLWVQRLELCGIVSNIPEQKTNAKFLELFTAECAVLLQSTGCKA